MLWFFPFWALIIHTRKLHEVNLLFLLCPNKFIKITVNIFFSTVMMVSVWLSVYQSVVDSLNIFILKLCIKIADISKSNIDLQQLYQLSRHFKLLAIRMTSLSTIFKISCIIFRRKLDIHYWGNLSLNNYTCLHYYNIISKQSWVDELF